MEGYQRDVHLDQIDAAIRQIEVVLAQLDGLDASISTADLLVESAARGEPGGQQAQTAIGRMARGSNGMRFQAREARNRLEYLRSVI